MLGLINYGTNIVFFLQLFVSLPSDLNDFMNIEPILHVKLLVK